MNHPALIAGLVALWSAPALANDLPASQPRLDLHGHLLPDGAVARLGDATLRTVRIRDFAFSPDGRSLARQRDSGVDLRELPSGRDITPPYLRGLTGAAFFFAPDGRHLVVESRTGRCRLFEPESGAVKLDLTLENRSPWFATLSRNGRAALVRWTDHRGAPGVTLYDLGAGSKPVATDLLLGQQGQVCLSADGNWLVAATEVGARLFEVATGKELPRPPLRHLGHVTAAALSPDGRTLAAAHADHFRLYPVTSTGLGEPLTRAPIEARGGMVWTADGRELLVACRDAVVRLNGKTGEVVSQLRPEAGTPNRGLLVLAPDGELAAEQSGTEPPFVWETRSGKILYRFPDRVPFLQVTCPDGRTVVTLGAGLRVEEWSLPEGRLLAARQHPSPNSAGWVSGQLSPDGRRLALFDGWSQSLQVCEANTGRLLRATDAWAGAFPSGIGFAPDGDRLIVVSRGRVGLADCPTGRLLRELPGPGLAVGYSSDGRLAAVLDRTEVRLVEVMSNRVRRTLPITEIPLDSRDVRFTAGRVRFSRDGRRLAIFGPCYRVWVWSVGDGELLYEDRGDKTNLYSDVWSGDLSPDGRWLAYPSEDGHGVRVLDLTNAWPGPASTLLRGQQGRVVDVTFSPDSRFLISAGADGTALVWDQTALGRTRSRSAEPVDVEALWQALEDPDAGRAAEAIEDLVRTPAAAVAVITRRLPPVELPDAAAVRRLVADLDSESFAVRDQAEKALKALRELAAPAILAAIQEPQSREHRERLERLLEQLDGAEQEPRRLQALRAVEVLERIGTPEARRALEQVSNGPPQARLTREARAALQRLSARSR